MKLLLILVFTVALIFIAPYPYYNPGESSWHFGPSLLGRSIGELDQGVAVEKIARAWAKATISSPLTIDCTVNSDCTSYTVQNQCEVYCGNADKINYDSVTQLEKKRICDTGLWKEPEIICYCVSSKCMELK